MTALALHTELRVAVLPHRAVSGINRIEEAKSTLDTDNVEAALSKQYTTDAHFVSYFLPGEAAWPRLNKPVLLELRERGVEIQGQLLVFDIDNPGHESWTRDTYQAFDLSLTHILSQDKLLSGYYAFYTTAHGCRLVYILDEPVHVEVMEEMLVGLGQLLQARGIEVDTLYDWTRLFRLPWVTRDDKQTWNLDEFPFALLEINPAYVPLPVDRVPKVPIPRKTAKLNPEDRVPSELPDLDTLDSLLWRNAANGERSEWYNSAKVRLQGRSYYDALFRSGTLAVQGGRNQAIFRSVGSAVGLLHTVTGTTPEHVFALFLKPILQFEEDLSNAESWEETLWRAIRTAWEGETAKANATDTVPGILATIQDNDLISGILAGVRTWCDPLKHLNDEELWSVFERKLVLVGPESYYVMRPTGYYDKSSVTSQQLAARIKDLGMGTLIQTQYVNDKGTLIQLSPEKISRICGHAVFDAVGSLRFDGGSWLRDVTEERPAVCEPMYALNAQLEPVFNEHVDTWLRHLAGPNYDKLTNWIGHSLDLAHPIAAMFLEGPPSIGKKMLALGLSECLRVPALAGSEELVSKFKTQILYSPFIFCNEGFPATNRGAGLKRPADVFREMIDGSPLYVDRKFKSPILVRAPYRLLITANNPNGLRALYGKQDLTPEDREALSVRLVHVRCTDDAATWLRRMGGPAYTGKPGARWVSGDAGEPSDFIVAKHFKHLYENRLPVPQGNRFLVEGDPHSAFVEEMSLNSGTAPIVLEVLFSMLQQQTRPKGLHVDDNGGIHVTASGLLDHSKNMDHPLRRELNTRNVCDVLRGLGAANRARLGDNVQRRWWTLDGTLLLREAEKGGSDVVKVLRDLRGDSGPVL